MHIVKELKISNFAGITIVIFMFISIWISKIPIITYDSGGYLLEGVKYKLGEISGGPGAATGFGNFSLIGNSFRSWPTVLLYALPIDNFYRALLQNTIFLVSILLLLHQFNKLFPLRATSHFAFLFFLLILIFNPTSLSQWFAIGPESLASSLLNFFFAILLKIIRESKSVSPKHYRYLLLLWFVTIILVITRFSLILYLLVPFLVTIYILSQLHSRIFAIFISTLLFIFSALYLNVIQKNQSEAWGEYTSEVVYRMFFPLNDNFPIGNKEIFKKNLPLDAPDCLKNYPENSLNWIEMGQYAEKICQENGVKWIKENYFRTLLNFYLSNPETTSFYLQEVSRAASTNWIYPGIRSPIPENLHRLTHNSSGDTLTNPSMFFLGLALIIFLMILLKRNTFSLRWILASTNFVVVSGFILSFIDIADSAQRKAFPGYYSLIIMILIFMFAFISRSEVSKVEIQNF